MRFFFIEIPQNFSFQVRNFKPLVHYKTGIELAINTPIRVKYRDVMCRKADE